MISYAELNSFLSGMLDAQGSNRYPPSFRITAFNYSIQRATTALGWMLANAKAPEEALRELTNQALFQTNAQGGIWLDDTSLGKGVWNVMAVMAQAGTTSPTTILPLPADRSAYRGDVAWDGTGKPCKRITLEQVALAENNMFMDGNEVLAPNAKMRTYAYYLAGLTATTSTSDWIPNGVELRVIPKSVTAKSLVNISYLQAPSLMTSTTSTVEFPASCTQILVDWAAEYIGIRQGDRTTLHSTAQQDAAMLFSFNAH